MERWFVKKRGNRDQIPGRNILAEQTFQENNSKPLETQKMESKRIKTDIKSEYLGNRLNPNYLDKFEGESFIVAGCGASLSLHDDFSKHYVIGVNDIERILTPDFLVVVNDHRTFMHGRWIWVSETKAPVIFSHVENPGPIKNKQNIVKLELGKRGVLDLDDKTKVDYTMNSPYMAVIIAYQMGAKKIAITGVDFTNNHFFQQTGEHKLNKQISNIDSEYFNLRKELEKRGIKVANLSMSSAIEAWPKMTLEEFENL
jgi:hypothetical protein